MATQSAAPPSQTDENTQNPASEVVQPIIEEQHDAKAVATEDNLTTSVFVNSEPIREEQVQNAVKFLSHPKVRGSPIIYRRSFLERKGLTKEEIDEAFRRVPDPTPAVSNVQPAAQNQDGRLKSSSNIQSQAPTQNPQPAAAAPGGVISKVSSLTQSRFNWSHAFYAVGILAVSGPGTAILLKNAIVPRLKSWICKVVLEEDVLTKKTNATPTLEEEATAAAKAAAAAAADVAQASQEMLMSKTEQKRYFEELMNLLDAQVQEMKLMSKTMRKLEGHSTTSGRVPHVEQEDHRVSITNSRQSNANGKVELDLHSVRSSPPPASVEPSVAPHPKSYMEIIAMVQRGERPPNISEINDLPPNPNQPVSNLRLASRAKPWDFGQSQNSLSHILPSQESSDGFNSQFADNGLINQVNGESKVPWWQQKNIRITEIENEDDHKTVSSDVFTNGRPVQNSWVPPQPPPVAMPEAAAAIRQAKKQSYQKEQLADEHLEAHSSDITDELQRMTKISESGVAEANGGSSKLNTSEIQAEGGAFESS
ncbi:peroxisomal membrane protein PEX14-like isoform X2 [Cornus florida]|uniref:peroxisomal membrane protein PEX14-like isoform X2 n=1 Tax=Cornus florida TaxID=4283 RepID=UPI00289A8445|nr:peroxisomal membrane protein PEX14-like isoform X2 [Cornus florida]